MKRNQFSQEKIITILHQDDKSEQTIAEICRQHAITETTFCRWRKIYAGLSVTEAQRLKELENENARLKRLLVGE